MAGIEEEDKKPIAIRDGEIECVPYLGSVVMSNGRLHAEVDRHIANASRAFGSLRKADFNDNINNKEESIQLLCSVNTTLWTNELDSPTKSPQKAGRFPS